MSGHEDLAALDRIEALAAELSAMPNVAAPEPARDLLDIVLELHAQGLARMLAMIASAEGGKALVHGLAEDAAIKGILLLHGLHPDSLEARIGMALEALHERLSPEGLDIRLLRSDVGAACVQLRRIGGGPVGGNADALRMEIEAAIMGAAPDLETLEIQGLDGPGATLAS